MDFFSRALWVFTAPGKVFDHVAEEKVSWWQPWIWVSVIYMVIGYFSQPIQRAVMNMNAGNLTAEQLQQQIDMFEKFGIIQLVATPVVFLVLGLIVGGITYILVSILSEKSSFKKFFTIYFYGGIVSTITAIINVLMVRMKGVETLRVPEDAQFSIGLGFLAPADGALIKAVLSGIEFFTIWSLVVVVIGLMRVFDMPKKHAIYCVIPMWIIGVFLLLLNNFFSGMN